MISTSLLLLLLPLADGSRLESESSWVPEGSFWSVSSTPTKSESDLFEERQYGICGRDSCVYAGIAASALLVWTSRDLLTFCWNFPRFGSWWSPNSHRLIPLHSAVALCIVVIWNNVYFREGRKAKKTVNSLDLNPNLMYENVDMYFSSGPYLGLICRNNSQFRTAHSHQKELGEGYITFCTVRFMYQSRQPFLCVA